MRVIDSKIDLGKSFEKFKPILKRAEKQFNNGQLKAAYYTLYFGIKEHETECTIPDNIPVTNADDIPKELFHK